MPPSPLPRGRMKHGSPVLTPRFLFAPRAFRPTMSLTASPAPFSKRGSGTPRDALSNPRRAARGCPHPDPPPQAGEGMGGGSSPLGVPLRLSPGRQLVPKALHQAMLRETVRGVRSCTAAPTGERRPRASPRELPAPEKRTKHCLRTASTSHTGPSAGTMMPDAARERVTNPPAGTALAPSQGVSSRRTSLRKARWESFSSEGGMDSRNSGGCRHLFDLTRLFFRCLFDSRRGNCGIPALIRISFAKARKVF
jgi:hypothetical protein